MENKEAAAQEPIRILVSGPANGGKSAVVALLAELLTTAAKFENVQVIYPDEKPSELKEKAAFLLEGKFSGMTKVLRRPVVIAECDTIHFGEAGTRNFSGALRRGNPYQCYQWNDAADLEKKELRGIETFGTGKPLHQTSEE